tara:strand:+ start:65 stop:589 length:525 start_codon:yes stop_codon:yes gene_type:complete
MTFTRDQIDAMLRTNDAAVERAIIRLFTMQNEDEQQWATTNAQNGRGFGAADARAGTRFARWLQGMDNKNVVRYAKKSLNHPRAERIFGRYTQDGGTVMDRARKIALKHSQQLVDFANAAVEREQARHQALQNKPSRVGPPAGTWAATARMMAKGDNSGFDWDAWKDQMKEGRL